MELAYRNTVEPVVISHCISDVRIQILKPATLYTLFQNGGQFMADAAKEPEATERSQQL